MNICQAPKVVYLSVILSLLNLQALAQKSPSKDFNNGLQLISKGLELKNLRRDLEREIQNEHETAKASKLRHDADDALRKSREAFVQAVAAFSSAAIADPTSFSARYYLGWTLNELEQYPKAIAPLDEARHLNPRDASTNFELGWAYDRMGRFEEAAELFKIAVNLQPDNAEAWFELGWVYEKTKRYQKAVEAYKQAIGLKTDDASAYYNLALAYLKLGDKNGATEQYVILKTLDPFLANSLSRAINK